MKLRLLLLVGIGFAPFGLIAQTTFLYNKGLMSVKGDYTKMTSNTTLYINGDFIAGGGVDLGGNVVTCNIYLEGSQTVLTGDFIHDINLTSKTYPSAVSNVFTLLEGAYESSYPKAAARFVFRGTKPQYIKLADGLIYGGGNIAKGYPQKLKGTNYINFPDLIIDNDKHVTLVPELAAQARNLSLDKGRLILDSRRAIASDFEYVNPSGTLGNIITDGSIHSTGASTMLAHFMMIKPSTAVNPTVSNIRTPNNADHATNKRPHDYYGSVQVNLAVDDPAVATANEKTGRSLIAMGSPYQEMRADYFFWNFLMVPTGESIIGENMPGNTMTDPKYNLKAGKAFVIGVDLRGTNGNDYKDIHPDYSAKGIRFEDRGGAGVADDNGPTAADKGKYFFSRFGPFFGRSVNIFQDRRYTTTNTVALPSGEFNGTVTDDVYTKEILNRTDVTIPLVKGYNYFSNPFTVPFDLQDIADAGNNGELSTEWGTGLKIGNSTNDDRVLANRVWILDPSSKGSGTYDVGFTGVIPGNKWVSVSAKYRVMRPVGPTGSTLGEYDPGTGETKGKFIIAPLQMFVLYANEKNNNAVGKSLTLPMSKRRIDNNALFLRSESATNKYEQKDDFLFHITDAQTKASDRVAIVIRTPQEVMMDAEYAPTKKMISFISTGQTATTSETVEGIVRQTGMSTMYTRDDQGAALESNVLGVPKSAETESVVLYVTPSSIAQNITLQASRLASADRVLGITLIDKVKNKEFDLFGGKAYTVASTPTDPVDRFTVRFTFESSNTSGIEDGGNTSESKNITSYYANGVLTVAGFEDSDFGSLISVFDIQGRRIAQAKVDGTSVEINKVFFAGAYVVKVVGNRSYAAKFLVK
ncbi:putative secreted protein (Por secretion system target) [Dysgonomonas alginatilytica]|uniref:Putative secreted protein (Por secretion system target) n=1 Tax=Dysgonomonas alginatilytica TaxID=1605892 RepID=A0A2V3PHH2_9BACT|nr:T9SS type A sorting domain-containing protein [Dysgonomonas alginatilytica]PXV58418.1 putative secreted protein (Por secretion system target) [Dysgonomonas alginatilytica]